METLKYSYKINQLPQNIKRSIKEYNIFYSDNYERYINKNGGNSIYVYSNKFILLVNIKSRYIFKYAKLPVEYLNWNKNEKVSKEDEQNFLDRCNNLLKKKFKVMWIEQPFTSAVFNTYPNNSKRIPFGNYIIDLSKEEGELWANVHSKHRNSVRKALKSGVIVKFGEKELLEDFYTLDINTRKRSKMKPIDKSVYINLLKYLEGNVKIVVSYKNNIPQGAALFYYNNHTCYYMNGASANKHEKGALNLLQWESIKYMKSRGVNFYNFVGCRINEDKKSKIHGIQRFKSRFGGQLKKCYLFKVVFNKNMYRLFIFLIEFKRVIEHDRNYNGDIIDQEIHKWQKLNIN